MSLQLNKLGRIFDPSEHELPADCIGFSQSPQAVVFDNFVRVFFSTRQRDTETTFRSQVAYVDYDLEFGRVLGIAEHPVISLGGLGSFDEHGIFPMNVLREGDRIHAYTTGWNRKVSVSADASIGYAVSEDGGKTFSKLGMGPIMTASLHEPFLVCDAFVQKFDGVYHMWYIFGTRWFVDEIEQQPQRVYKIAHAQSTDGINFQRDGEPIISDRVDENECQALPSVIRIGDQYVMFFCYRHASGFRSDSSKGYRLGCAYSDDLIHWTRDDDYVSVEHEPGTWDADMFCYPFAFQCHDKNYLLYNGNHFGRDGFGIAEIEALST